MDWWKTFPPKYRVGEVILGRENEREGDYWYIDREVAWVPGG